MIASSSHLPGKSPQRCLFIFWCFACGSASSGSVVVDEDGLVGGGDGTAGGGEAQGGHVVVDEDLLDGGGHRLPGGGVPGGDLVAGGAPVQASCRGPGPRRRRRRTAGDDAPAAIGGKGSRSHPRDDPAEDDTKPGPARRGADRDSASTKRAVGALPPPAAALQGPAARILPQHHQCGSECSGSWSPFWWSWPYSSTRHQCSAFLLGFPSSL